MQGPGKQQGTEDAIQQRRIKVDGSDEPCQRGQVEDAHAPEPEHHHRSDQRDHHEPDRGGQADPAKVRVGKEGRQRGEPGQQVKGCHRGAEREPD